MVSFDPKTSLQFSLNKIENSKTTSSDLFFLSFSVLKLCIQKLEGVLSNKKKRVKITTCTKKKMILNMAFFYK